MALTQKRVKFLWSKECEKSFQELKDSLTSASVLTLPEESNGFVVYCDASRIGLGQLSKGSVAHVDDDKKNLIHDVHRLARLGVRLVDYNKGGVIGHKGSKSSFVSDVKAKQGFGPILDELKETVLKISSEVFSQGRDRVI
ncbi:hypothetical protein MTR67_031835 [Solanum verrucosum]|uniref:Reverse transcriptase/retrotransposon-derived protein RNase H-like domain-containing protein n=1 Tax=Solanum verrucosum TaxID=315347 RepID=A0AAF0ZGV7_SOLVR|nr:hypothetical protein MTR67_031835 [Solanum verrucosum]